MRYREFLTSFKRAYRHKGGTKALELGKLEATWFRQIQEECAWIYDHAGSSDVTDQRHVTYWTRPSGEVRQFSLFNETGKSEDTKGDYGYLGDIAKKRLVFPHLSALGRFAALFQPMLRNLRLNGMGAGSSLDAHEENCITASGLGRTFILRFHLPVFTNPAAHVFLDDEKFQFAEGHLYFFHHGCVHAAANAGKEPRYHLVLDCFLNRSLFAHLFPGHPSPDSCLIKTTDETAVVRGIPSHFPEFVSEGGRVIRGSIDYGRSLPSPFTYFKKNYPSLFDPLHTG